MNESFMFIFIFTVLALGEKCARFVHFIHGSFTELVNRERLHEHARYADASWDDRPFSPNSGTTFPPICDIFAIRGNMYNISSILSNIFPIFV